MHLSRRKSLIVVLFLFANSLFAQSSGFGSDLDMVWEDSFESQDNSGLKKYNDEEFDGSKVSEDALMDQEYQAAEKAEKESLGVTEETPEDTVQRETVPMEQVQENFEEELQGYSPQQREDEYQQETVDFGEPTPVLEKLENQEEVVFGEESLEEPYPYEEPAQEPVVEGVPKDDAPAEDWEPSYSTYPAPSPRIEKGFSVTPPKLGKEYTEDELKRISKETGVEVEGTDFLSGESSFGSVDVLKTYKGRRPPWTKQVELFSSTYEPIHYTSEIVPTIYEDYYDPADVPLSGVGLEVKRNFSFGAIGLGGSFSYFSSQASLDDSQLTILAPSLKASLYLDTLFEEPYIVPYASFGYSYISYKEKYEDAVEIIEVDGATDNFFVSFGVSFQLDWMDPSADRSGYAAGIENTFIFVEGRFFLDRGIVRSEEDPDFSSDVHIAAGIRLEF